MSSPTPVVSVVVPCYRQGDFLHELLRSVFGYERSLRQAIRGGLPAQLDLLKRVGRRAAQARTAVRAGARRACSTETGDEAKDPGPRH